MPSPGVLQAAQAGVLRAIPRRPPLVDANRGPERLQNRVVHRPRPSRWYIARRFFAWTWSFIQYLFARTIAQIKRTHSPENEGVLLRQFFERLGAIANKIGQQLAVRVDFLPPEVCNELGRLMDDAPAFPFEYARERIEAAIGRPLEEVFRRIDPEPIGAASISVVWRGELLDGTTVAIKVRRPSVAELFSADLTLIEAATKIAEILTLVRPGYLQNFRFELRDMLMTELDFCQEADYQSIFRRIVKRDRLKWVTAPRVFGPLSSTDVMVSEFAPGVPCIKILQAVENKDEAKLAEFKKQDIDPDKIGERVFVLGTWMRLESFFFHSDPHPGNIFVCPGNKLVLIDFGSCGISSSKQRVCEFEIARKIITRDAIGAANAAIASLAPLPDIDIQRMRRYGWGAFWSRTIDLECGEAEWWERTTASLWLALFAALADLQIPINVDTLRLLRASLLTDTLAYRLNRKLDLSKSWNKWLKTAMTRAQRRSERELRKASRGQWARAVNDYKRTQEIVERGLFWGDRFVRELPREFASSMNRFSFTASVMLRFTLVGTLVALVIMAVAPLYGWGSSDSPTEVLLYVFTQPLGALGLLFATYLAIMKIQTKLEEKGNS